jgi:alkylation response protein AidB-like acyl-CoA dehydrogenase
MTTMISAPAPADLRAACAELYCADLAPMLRRLGEHPFGAGAGSIAHPDDMATRDSVWAALAGFGVLRARPQRDLVEVAELAGWALHRSPLPEVLFGTDLMNLTDDPAYRPVLGAVADGAVTVATAVRADAGAGPDQPGALRAHPDGTVDADRALVAFAADAAYLVLAGTDRGRTLLAVIDAGQPGVTLRRHDDITRGDLYAVTARGATTVGVVHDITAGYPVALARARIRHAAGLAGAARGAIELAVERLRTRSAFGRPLAAMQSLAYRFAALSARTAAVLSSARAIALAADEGADVRLAATEVALLAAVLVREAAAESVHAHGAYGMTEDCDAQLYYRQAAVDSAWLGTPTSLRQEAGRLLAASRGVTPTSHDSIRKDDPDAATGCPRPGDAVAGADSVRHD